MSCTANNVFWNSVTVAKTNQATFLVGRWLNTGLIEYASDTVKYCIIGT